MRPKSRSARVVSSTGEKGHEGLSTKSGRSSSQAKAGRPRSTAAPAALVVVKWQSSVSSHSRGALPYSTEDEDAGSTDSTRKVGSPAPAKTPPPIYQALKTPLLLGVPSRSALSCALLALIASILLLWLSDDAFATWYSGASRARLGGNDSDSCWRHHAGRGEAGGPATVTRGVAGTTRRTGSGGGVLVVVSSAVWTSTTHQSLPSRSQVYIYLVLSGFETGFLRSIPFQYSAEMHRQNSR